MGLFSNKISREEVKPGDHIYSWRTAYVYAHHGSLSLTHFPLYVSIILSNVSLYAGIYVGDNKVIHFTRGGGRQTETGTFLDKLVVSSSPNYPQCLVCKDHSSFNGDKVITSCLDCFLAGGNLYLFKYNVSRSSFLAKPRGGTCTLAPSDPPEDVLVRANFQLHMDGWFGDYDVTENNCEDFAIYCKTGLLVCKKNRFGTSGQVNAAAAASLALALHACGLSMLGVGVYCYGRVASDVSRNGDVIKVPAKKLVSILESDRTSPREGWLSIAGPKFRGE
ncbi:unnamed protein product [Brassica oleracea]|uniref:(rape) hypothetical protein n=1 Tax=Brassica napus TaxID=3708 RepID=A0A816J514_BRANA|nr:unnamed protein product [Brassica napus]